MIHIERLTSLEKGFLVGWTGAAGAGKNVCGEYMSNKLNIPTYAFAKPLKDSVNEMFGWGEEHKEGELKEIVAPNKTSFQKIESILIKNFGWIIQPDEIRDYATKWVAILTLKLEEQGKFVLSLKNNDLFITEILMEISPRQAYQWFGTEWGRDLIHKDIWLMFAERELKENDMKMIVTDARFDNEAEWIKNLKGRIIKVQKEVNRVVANHASENGISSSFINYTINNNVLDDEFETLYRSIDTVIGDLKNRI